MAGMDEIDVYPVGLLRNWQHFRRSPDRLRAWRTFCYRLRDPFRYAAEGNWRAVKSHFNGYLAEPVSFPPGLGRCGSGWTRGRARRDLQRRMERAGV